MCSLWSQNSDCPKMEGEKETKEVVRRKDKQKERRGEEIEACENGRRQCLSVHLLFVCQIQQLFR